jgi:hypothetical protein
MGTRGRVSLAAVEAPQSGLVQSLPRAEPPEELTREQADEWWGIVNRLPAEWFPRETLALLVQYCRHVVTARRVAQMVADAEASDELDIVVYDRLLKMQQRESLAVTALGTKLRITNQSLLSKKTGKPSMVRKPWE